MSRIGCNYSRLGWSNANPAVAGSTMASPAQSRLPTTCIVWLCCALPFLKKSNSNQAGRQTWISIGKRSSTLPHLPGSIQMAASCMQMCLVHDLAEGLAGDITPRDGISKLDKHVLEQVRAMFPSFPKQLTEDGRLQSAQPLPHSQYVVSKTSSRSGPSTKIPRPLVRSIALSSSLGLTRLLLLLRGPGSKGPG